MDLEKLRVEIDHIDDELLGLFKKRMNIAAQVAEYKQKNNLPVVNRARERDILYRMCQNVDAELEYYTGILYNTIFDISRTYQNTLMESSSAVEKQINEALSRRLDRFPQTAAVACQGIEGSYSQIATEKIFATPKIMYMDTFDGVINAVDKGLCRYGILPIDNSTAGSVTMVYELMKKYKFYIAKSVQLRINHVLLGKKDGELEGIRQVYSHEQAINQCSDFLKKNPKMNVQVCENTAMAAKLVAESESNQTAAISSRDCAEIYGLKVLSDEIQNSDNNYTRFICISKELEIYQGANKISLMIALGNKVGALYSLITKFSVLGLNLTKLESRPIKGTDFEFMFYFDVDGVVDDPKVRTLLGQLEKQLDSFTFLGNYKID